jgi:hypothetical protein
MSSAYALCALDYGVSQIVVEGFSVSIGLADCWRGGEFFKKGFGDRAFACGFEAMEDYISSWCSSYLWTIIQSEILLGILECLVSLAVQ